MESSHEGYENPAWQKTHDALGIKPKHDLYCPICLASKTVAALEKGQDLKDVTFPRLFIRRSRIHQVVDARIAVGTDGHKQYAFDTICKCAQCDYYCVFGVPTDLNYALKIMELRDNSNDFLVPIEYWKDEVLVDDDVREKLAALGYV